MPPLAVVRTPLGKATPCMPDSLVFITNRSNLCLFSPPIPRGVPRDATPYIWGKCKGWLTQNTNGTYFYSKDVMGDGLLYVCAFKIGVGVSSVRGWVYIPS